VFLCVCREATRDLRGFVYVSGELVDNVGRDDLIEEVEKMKHIGIVILVALGLLLVACGQGQQVPPALRTAIPSIQTQVPSVLQTAVPAAQTQVPVIAQTVVPPIQTALPSIETQVPSAIQTNLPALQTKVPSALETALPAAQTALPFATATLTPTLTPTP
jgi:hypothetical protein